MVFYAFVNPTTEQNVRGTTNTVMWTDLTQLGVNKLAFVTSLIKVAICVMYVPKISMG